MLISLPLSIFQMETPPHVQENGGREGLASTKDPSRQMLEASSEIDEVEFELEIPSLESDLASTPSSPEERTSSSQSLPLQHNRAGASGVVQGFWEGDSDKKSPLLVSSEPGGDQVFKEKNNVFGTFQRESSSPTFPFSVLPSPSSLVSSSLFAPPPPSDSSPPPDSDPPSSPSAPSTSSPAHGLRFASLPSDGPSRSSSSFPSGSPLVSHLSLSLSLRSKKEERQDRQGHSERSLTDRPERSCTDQCVTNDSDRAERKEPLVEADESQHKGSPNHEDHPVGNDSSLADNFRQLSSLFGISMESTPPNSPLSSTSTTPITTPTPSTPSTDSLARRSLGSARMLFGDPTDDGDAAKEEGGEVKKDLPMRKSRSSIRRSSEVPLRVGGGSQGSFTPPPPIRTRKTMPPAQEKIEFFSPQMFIFCFLPPFFSSISSSLPVF